MITSTYVCDTKYFKIHFYLEHGKERIYEVTSKCNQTKSYDDDLRLHKGTGFSGVLQIYNNNKWRNLCADYFNMIEGQVACRQLGFSTLEMIGSTQRYLH